MSTSQFLGVHAAGIIFGGSIYLARRFHPHDPFVARILMGTWTYFALLCGHMTDWFPEVRLLAHYMLLIDVTELATITIRVHTKSILSRFRRLERLVLYDIPFIALGWFPCYSLAQLLTPQFAHVDIRLLGVLELFMALYAALVSITGDYPDRAAVTSTLVEFVSVLTFSGFAVYYVHELIEYLKVLDVDWGWIARLMEYEF